MLDRIFAVTQSKLRSSLSLELYKRSSVQAHKREIQLSLETPSTTGDGRHLELPVNFLVRPKIVISIGSQRYRHLLTLNEELSPFETPNSIFKSSFRIPFHREKNTT